MATINQVINGLSVYLDKELIPCLDGWQKWTVGAYCTIALHNASNVASQLLENDYIKALGVVSDGEEIDIDVLHDAFMEQAKKESISLKVPILNSITLKASDIDKLYNYIKEMER